MNFFNLINKIIIPSIHAATDDIVGTLTAPSGIPSEVTSTNPLLRTIIIFLITLASLYSFIQFILGGFGIISAGGDSAKVETAQKQITNAIIGLVVIGASFLIAAIVGKLLFGRADFIFNPELQKLQTVN